MQQQGETGIAGVALKLTPGNVTATTDANGNYSFSNLTIGTYTITETQPNNVIQGINTAGTLGGLVDPQQVDVISQIVVNGVSGTGYTFAEQSIPVNAAPAPTANNQAVAAQQNGTITGNVITGTGNAPAAPAFQAAARPRALSAPVSAGGEYALLVPNTGPQYAASFTLNRDGSFVYVPLTNYYGPDSFQYEVVDAAGRIATAQVNITISHVDQPPQANPEAPVALGMLDKGSTDLNLMEFAQDIDSPQLTFTVKSVVGGEAKVLSDGHTIQFTPAASFTGSAIITYTCSDGQLSTILSLQVQVDPTPAAPKTKTLVAHTLPSTAVTLDPLSSDTPTHDMGLYLMSVNKPAHGTAYIVAGNSEDPSTYRVVYRPDFGFHGTETISYVASSFDGAIANGKILVTITPGAAIGIDPTDASLTALDVFGTTGGDTITLKSTTSGITVTMNGKSLGVFNPSGLVAVFGGNGNDTINASGIANNVALFGEAGNDTLIAGSGKAVLVGGIGSDKLYAGPGTDELISGTADYWRTFAPLATLFNGGTHISSWVHADNEVDQLYGGAGNDTFWATVSGSGNFDILHNRRLGEAVVPLN